MKVDRREWGTVVVGLGNAALGRTIQVPGDYGTIQGGIDAGAAGDTLLVTAGRYTGEGNKDLDFHGVDLVLTAQAGPGGVVIDCEGDGRSFYFHSGETPAAVVSGVTMTGGGGRTYGGGVYCASASSPTLSNCLIVGNSATYGGAIHVRSSSPVIVNCTLTGNDATQYGGGMRSVSCSPTLTHCILWGDSPDEIKAKSGNPVIVYSDVEGGYEGEGNLDSAPLFVDAAGGDYHLSEESPCVDAGTLDGAPKVDFEGDARPRGSGIDIGADEYGSIGSLRLFLTDSQPAYGRGGPFSMTINVENSAEGGLGLTRGILWAESPPVVDYTRVLYDGPPFVIGGGDTFVYPFELTIPPGAPLGTYTVGVTIYDGNMDLSADSFQFEME